MPRPVALAVHSLALSGNALAKNVTWDDITNDHLSTHNVLQYGNRGAAIYGDRIYFGTLDARVMALHKDTGKGGSQKKPSAQ